MQERLEAIVRGRVQMVMYRDFAQRKARRLNLKGEVQNLLDGTVRVVAEGPREMLDVYLQRLQEGPLLAHVDAVEVTKRPFTGEFNRFTIRYGE